MISDKDIKEFINTHRNNLTMRRERSWYEDSWTETVVNDDAVFNLIKEVLKASEQ
jgi:hypothetical protein